MDAGTRATLDTNIFISAYFSDGISREIVRLGRKSFFKIIMSRYICTEYLNKMKVLDSDGESKWQSMISLIERNAIVVPVSKIQKSYLQTAIRDPNDIPILKTAVAGKAGFVVTYDKDLLDLTSYKNIQLIPPRHFIEILKSQGKRQTC